MTNYFSIGIESRVGIGFDRNRKGSVFLNKMVYLKEGIKKMCACHHTSTSGRTLKVKEFLSHATVEDQDSSSNVFACSKSNDA